MKKKFTGAVFEIHPRSGFITGIYLSAGNPQEEQVIRQSVEKICNRQAWPWLRRLMNGIPAREKGGYAHLGLGEAFEGAGTHLSEGPHRDEGHPGILGPVSAKLSGK